MTSRQLLAAVGAGSLFAVVGVLLPWYTAVTLPRTALLLFVFVTVGVAIPALLIRRTGAKPDRPSLPDPERPIPAKIPGETFDMRLEEVSLRGKDETSHTVEQIREQLQTVATETLVVHQRLSLDEATTRIENGSWTDDRIAAAFLGESPTELSPADGLLDRLRSGPDSIRNAVERTIDELVRTTGRTPTSAAADSVDDCLVNDSRETRSSDSDSGYTVTASEETIRATNRWRGMSALALFGLGVGVAFEEPGILFISAVGIGYTAYARTHIQPTIDVSATRTLSTESPQTGDAVTVTVTVRNNGTAPLPDLRLIDGVPAALSVTDGSPRHGTPLPAGGEATFEYTIQARRGHHEFGPVRVLARDLAETVERDVTVPADTSFTCRPVSIPTDSPSLRTQLTRFIGQIPTTTGGDGIEFHSTRTYRRGDPIGRIDWKRFARTRTLSTIAFREERATTVILVIDSRKSAYVAPRPAAPTACDRSITAAAKLMPQLKREGNTIGLAAVSPTPCWIPASSGRPIQTRITDALTTHPAFSQRPPTESCYTSEWIAEFRRQISQSAQVLFFSPVCDAGAVRTARSLDAYGYPVTVISPDPTTLGTVGNRFASLERQVRLYELRHADIRVVDWQADQPLDAALLRAARRWSQ